MTELARCSNLMVKLSGLSTFDRACSTVIEETVGLFGPNRCLLGSSFSIEKTVDRLRQLGWCNADNLSRYAEHERRVVLHNTAVHLYKL
jgi:predicted TIM-barrel fold metal-dependent hydrolase